MRFFHSLTLWGSCAEITQVIRFGNNAQISQEIDKPYAENWSPTIDRQKLKNETWQNTWHLESEKQKRKKLGLSYSNVKSRLEQSELAKQTWKVLRRN